MLTHNTNTDLAQVASLGDKVKAYGKLLKFRLSFLVCFSGAMGYFLGAAVVDWNVLMAFVVGGFLITGSANTINQILEVEYDRMMKRTMGRPLPTSVLTKKESWIYAVVLAVVGMWLQLYYVNVLTAGISMLSLALYAFAYTPLKRVGPIAVFVGAFPGAFPPLIGWVAGTGYIGYEAIVLFGIQFIWQFPHFWAVAWVAYEDYKKAGFKLLPSKGGRDLNTAFNIMIYTLFLIPLSLLPYFANFTGKTAAIIVLIAGVMFLAQTFYLMKRCDRKAALWMMFGSFFYLPIVQIAIVADQI